MNSAPFMFLRPDFLWLFAVVAVFACWQIWRNGQNQTTSLIAPHLAKKVMPSAGKANTIRLWPTLLALTLLVLASAGPSFHQQQVPVYSAQAARVLVMDMSRSMYSQDITPTRLVQARYKALDMVNRFQEGETGLVAYAGEAFTISPLTNDSGTLDNLIPSLSPDIMPSQGSNVVAGLEQAKELLEQSGYVQGDIVLLTDGVDASDEQYVREWLSTNDYSLYIYAIGSEQGAPIQLPEGGFLKDSAGQIVIPKTDYSVLERLARAGQGKLLRYQANNDNMRVLDTAPQQDETLQEQQNKTLWRIDAGIYLVLMALPLLLWQIHTKAIAVIACVLLLPFPKSYASEASWFNNAEQNALNAYQSQAYEQATQSENPLITGAALYQQKQYEQALQAFNKDSSAQGLYNQGNALAQLGELDTAIERYQQAIDANPDFEAAKQNKALLEQLKQQQEQQQEQQSQENSEQQDSEQQQQDSGEGQSSEDQGGEGQEQQGDSDSQSQQSEQPGERNSEQNNRPENQAQSQQAQQSQQQNDQTPSAAKQSQEQTPEQQQAQAMPSEQGEGEENENAQQQAQAQLSQLTPEQREQAQQLNQLLRKIPDSPEILLRNKMQLEAQKRQFSRSRRPQGVEKSW